jgi:hypothetical protein
MKSFMFRVLHPEIYHGKHARPPFFEGWYFKLVNSQENQRWAVIPGVFINDSAQSSHAFIQVLNGQTGRVDYLTYPIEDFSASADAFEIQIGPNRFTSHQIELQILQDEIEMIGEVKFESPRPWPVSLLSPGVMGWYAWVPGMECYHGVLSFYHPLSGRLRINSENIDFSGGTGYMEKDWGQAFPSAWVWMQTNHFTSPQVCLTASIAVIPWQKRSFAGMIIGLRHEEHLYRFATYTGARVEMLRAQEHELLWVVKGGGLRLEMRAERTQGGLLQAPTPQGMGRRISETLTARVETRLSTLGGNTIFHETGRNAGLEAVGDLASLVHLLKLKE